MPSLVTLLYPAVDFDLDYYLNSHMPLVWKTWEKSGLLDWKVIELDPASGNVVQCLLEWESVEAFQKAVATKEGEFIMADIPNYTPGKPTTIAGKIVGLQK